MIGIAKPDNLGRSRVAPCRQDRRLVGLRPAAGEERFRQLPARRDLRQLLGQRRLRLIRENRRHVLQPVDLRMQPLFTDSLQWPTLTVTMPPKKSRY